MVSSNVDYAALISESTELVKDLLQAFAGIDDFLGQLGIAFGNVFDQTTAQELQVQWLEGTFELPRIEVRSQFELAGANGAYAAATDTIYLAEEFLSQNNNSLEAVAEVLLEEYGHAIDQELNESDAIGDEGAIWTALLKGRNISERQLSALHEENDNVTIELDGQLINVEQASHPNSFYSLQVIAKNGNVIGGENLERLEESVSINDVGEIAFVGDFDSVFGNNGIIVGSNPSNLQLRGTKSSNQNYDDEVQINNKGEVASSFTTQIGNQDIARLWRNDNTFQNILVGGSGQTTTSIGRVSINNNSSVIYAGRQGSVNLTLLGSGTSLGSLVSAGKPMIADNNNVVKIDSNGTNLRLVRIGPANNPLIATSSSFSNLGKAPGIRADF